MYKNFIKESKKSNKTYQKVAEILLAFFLPGVLSAMLNGFN
ncbi:hypothetical protein SCODD09_01359 [Streptococcus constellatus]|nr:hypothetical protein SCODD09_01359 [Streptococcus constellatus]